MFLGQNRDVPKKKEVQDESTARGQPEVQRVFQSVANTTRRC